ncbi:MAG TPA: ribonuclease H-like domain-containing protein [Xanthomonadales bacterium]|nr:ribonuclease H-like domain-containing protein [Xanthomonadales bacterium]
MAWERDAATGPLLFLDTETTGLSGGTGTLVFMLGIARIVDGRIEAEQWLLTRPSGEPAMLDAIAATVPREATLVSFNGKAFDAPLIAARHALHRRPDPFARRVHWDLLAPTRRAFETRWPDCRLQTAERRLLGIERVDDLPGAFAPAAFTTLLRSGDGALMRRVLDHNRQDLFSLAHLLAALVRVYADPQAFDADAASVARKLIANDRPADAERALQAALATQRDASRELARLRRRQGDHAAAAQLWRPLAASGCAHALESLAKLEEHVHRDLRAALALAQRLVSLEPANLRHAHRLARLQRRLSTPL